MAERVGFEPTCRLPDNTLSRRARYDHFGTSPVEVRTACKRTLIIPRTARRQAAAPPRLHPTPLGSRPAAASRVAL